MIPRYVRSPSEFAAYIKLGETTESIVLDFKETLNDWDVPKKDPKCRDRLDKAQRETCRDLAQFANTDGGCLLIGIREAVHPSTRLKVAMSIQALREPDGMKQWIEQAVRKYLVPATFSHDTAIVQAPVGPVICVNISPSPQLVTLWNHPACEFVRRTSHGKDWMNPDEME